MKLGTVQLKLGTVQQNHSTWFHPTYKISEARSIHEEQHEIGCLGLTSEYTSGV